MKLRLGEICKMYQPKTISTEMLVDGGQYPVYGANGIIGHYDQYNHVESELLMTCRGATCGTINVSLPYSWINGNAMVIHPINDNIVFDYLKYHLQALDLSTVITGAAQPQITRQSLVDVPVNIPPVEEQNHIARELDLLTGIIDKKNAQLRDLDALAQSIFYEMFGDPIANDKRWGMKKVIEVVKMQRGFDLPVQDRVSTGRIPVYGSNGIVGMHSQSKVSEGIITGRSGTIGRVDCCRNPFWPLNTTLFSIDCRGNNVIYLKYLMSNFHLKRFSAGAGVPTLNRNDFHEEPIIDVPLEMQVSFASKVEAIENYKNIIRQSLTENQLLLDSRMNAYFT